MSSSRRRFPTRSCARADELQLVDLTPVALRNRLARGDVYPPERIDAALANYFRPGNLAALRELALAWLADRVDEGLEEYRRSHGIEKPWETRERVLVALTGSPDGERLIRRASRMAQRMNGELVAVHVVPQDGLAAPTAELLERQRELVGELGASYHEVVGEDIGDALLDAARSLNVTQIVMGASRRSRWQRLTQRLGDREGDPRVRHADRRPRRQPPGRGRGGLRAPADAPARLAAAAAHRARLRARRPRTARTRLRALQPARADRAAECPPPLSAARRVDGGARRPLAGAPLRRQRHPARQLVLHSPAAHVHDRARREHPGPGRVPRRRDDGQPLRRSRGEALRSRPKGAGRGRGARPSRRLGSGRGRARQPAARAERRGSCGSAPHRDRLADRRDERQPHPHDARGRDDGDRARRRPHARARGPADSRRGPARAGGLRQGARRIGQARRAGSGGEGGGRASPRRTSFAPRSCPPSRTTSARPSPASRRR